MTVEFDELQVRPTIAPWRVLEQLTQSSPVNQKQSLLQPEPIPHPRPRLSALSSGQFLPFCRAKKSPPSSSLAVTLACPLWTSFRRLAAHCPFTFVPFNGAPAQRSSDSIAGNIAVLHRRKASAEAEIEQLRMKARNWREAGRGAAAHRSLLALLWLFCSHGCET